MSYVGDFKLGNTLDTKFTTRQISGAPFTLAGSPVISCYVGNGTTELTAGITLSVDFDSRTGLNNIRVVATSGNGYATATDNQLVITTGTVNSVSVVGEVVGEFSIENRRADVQFWNGTQVSSPATAGIPDVNAKNAGNTAWGSGAITAASIAAAALNGKGDWSTVNPTNLTAAQIATGVWQDATAGDFTAANSIGKSVMNGVALGTGLTVNALTTNNDKTGYSLTQTFPANFSALAITAGGAVTAGTVSDKTGYSLTAAYDAAKTASQAGDAMALTGGERTSLNTVIKTTAVTESYRANGAAPTEAQFMCEVLAHLGESSISGVTKTANKFDHSTPAATYTLDSATLPAAITRAT